MERLVRGKLLAVDTETTGLDPYHGSRPYLVTTCDDSGKPRCWVWEVDPLTRMPAISAAEREDIRRLIWGGDETLVGHNLKFDVHALRTVLGDFVWPWERTVDTLLAAHLLNSAQPKNLTDLCTLWLGHDIEPLEKALHA